MAVGIAGFVANVTIGTGAFMTMLGQLGQMVMEPPYILFLAGSFLTIGVSIFRRIMKIKA